MGLKKFPEQFLRSQEMGLFKKIWGPKGQSMRYWSLLCGKKWIIIVEGGIPFTPYLIENILIYSGNTIIGNFGINTLLKL